MEEFCEVNKTFASAAGSLVEEVFGGNDSDSMIPRGFELLISAIGIVLIVTRNTIESPNRSSWAMGSERASIQRTLTHQKFRDDERIAHPAIH